MKTNPRPAQRMPSSLCRIFLLGTLALAGLPLAAKEIPTALEMARQLNEAFIGVAENVSPAVAVIEIAHKADFLSVDADDPLWDLLPPELRRNPEFRRELEQELEKRRRRSERAPTAEPRFDGRGSGVVIRPDGYILTNTHVVEGAEKIKVRFKNGKEYAAEIRGTDPQSDIAVLKINARDLPVAIMGDSAKTRVGEFAIAIGAPLDLDYSVTFGHVSAKGRTQIVPAWGENSLGASMDQDFIQTDASINPGNSGGPLVNINGEVIGINTLIRGLRTGIGFAIPSNLAKLVSDQLISDGKVTRAWIGVSVEPLKTSVLRRLVEGVEDGLVISTIQPDGPATKSELRRSDIVTAVNGTPVSTAQQLRNAVREKKVGSEIVLDVFRLDGEKGRKPMKVTVVSEAWPEEIASVAANARRPRESQAPNFGLIVQPLTKDLAEKYGVTSAEGLIVTEVKRGSPADQKRIRPGDIVKEIITDGDRKPVATLEDFRDAITAAAGSKGVTISLLSEGFPEFRILKDSGD